MTATVSASTRRLLAWPTTDLSRYARVYGEMPWSAARALVPTLQAAGLTGRGGAGFPTWRKIAAVAEQPGGSPVVIANAAESEPASAKDRELLIQAPHLVLDGLQLVADAVGARTAYVYAQSAAIATVTAALAARSGWDHVATEVVRAPDAFVAGQETSVVAAIEGRPARPRDGLVRVAEAGVNGAPTVVQNAETLAQIALIARYGPDWFRSAGTPDEPGTFLATRSGALRAPGVVEVPYGVALSELIGAFSEPPQALLVGGYHGAWVPADPAIAVSRAGLAPFGAGPGAGVVVALPATSCGLAYTSRVVDFLAAQSARQCGPCLNGLPRLAHVLGRLARGQAEARVMTDLAILGDLVTGRGACQHPDGTVRLVRSTLTMFANDVRAHLGGRCLAQASGGGR